MSESTQGAGSKVWFSSFPREGKGPLRPMEGTLRSRRAQPGLPGLGCCRCCCLLQVASQSGLALMTGISLFFSFLIYPFMPQPHRKRGMYRRNRCA